VSNEAAGWSVLLQPRRRRHLAALSAILLVTVFGFVLLQPRRVRVQADGREITVATNLANNEAVLRASGVRVGAGDRVTALMGDGLDVLRVERAHTVRLDVDGATYVMRTHAKTIDQLLTEADVAIADRDSVLQNGQFVSSTAPVQPPRLFATIQPADDGDTSDVAIEVRRAVPFTVIEDGRQLVSTSSRPTVAQALREAGVSVGPGDALTPDLQASLEADMRIELRHAKPVTITLPDDHEVVYTLAGTVGEALSAASVVLPDGAYIDPPPDTPVTYGMSVRVVQLSSSNDVEREYIESGTEYKPDDSLEPGETRTMKGHDGAHVRRYAVSYVNGEEATRDLIDEYDDPAPVDTVIYYSTRSAQEEPTSDASTTSDTPPDTASEPALSAEPAPGTTGARTLRVYATWYSPASSGRSRSDPAYGRTATGRIVTYGIVAVDPAVIPLGTRLYIPGYGNAVAADTGGAVSGYVIDLGYPDGVAVDWQSKWVDIQILS
jgi:uncharacterized protein YabE (DUF348 family)/3D (Asp-Asp-Asp) domain-containing protein